MVVDFPLGCLKCVFARKQGGFGAPEWFQKGESSMKTAEFQAEVVELPVSVYHLAFHPSFLIPIYITLSRYHVSLSCSVFRLFQSQVGCGVL